MTGPKTVDVDKLHRNVRWALQNDLDPRELVPMLKGLAHHAPAGSETWVFAKLELATALVQTEPWRAARLATDVLEVADVEYAWGLLALAHTLLENYRCALSAYGRALRWSPTDPSYLHNLGHLLDVVFGRPLSAVRWLEAATRSAPNDPEVRASLAHALLRAGKPAKARDALRRALGERADEADAILRGWSRQVVALQGRAPETSAEVTECAVDA